MSAPRTKLNGIVEEIAAKVSEIRRALRESGMVMEEPQPAPVPPEPLPGFTIKRAVPSDEIPESGAWLWYVGAPGSWRSRGCLEVGSVGGKPIYELTGPPELPRFEHTGEFRVPNMGEWFLWGDEFHLRVYSGFSEVEDYWILRKVEPVTK